MLDVGLIELDPTSDARWDAYVGAHPQATIYHLGAWSQILSRSYGFRPRYLALAEGESLRGVLPLFRKKGLMSGARLRSIPVFSYGGPLADDPRLETRLIEAARDMAAAEGEVAGMMINTGERQLAAPEGFVIEEILPRWIVDVPADLEALRATWRKTSNNLFRSLKKADAADLIFREASSDGDLRSFHRLYVRTMKKHRSLPRSLRQLRLERDTLGEAFKVFIVDCDEGDVAAGAYHVWGDTIELLYNGSHEDALRTRPNHALYWHVMQWAAARGLRRVDLGGAYADTPLAQFKQQWGATPRARFRLTHRAGAEATRAESIASVGYGAGESENRLLDAVWRHLPAPLLRLGAHVAYRYV
jgi:CelD/BcsL family acetyltransferase involved in cellulose biosynthesis